MVSGRATPSRRAATIVTILNVGEVVTLEDLDQFQFGVGRAGKEQQLDALLLKAIELAEFQRAWDAAV